jgi:glycosyltransferase involved in cell wall biosynthesis
MAGRGSSGYNLGHLRLSIIIPFHRNLDQLGRCLAALAQRPSATEVIVVADGAVDDCRQLAADHGATVLPIPGPNGPAVARNRGAAVARGEVLAFVDADVAIEPENLRRLDALFRAQPDVAAVFGAYDEDPPEPHFVSQYKNLAHSFIHQTSNVVAQTFWAGFGAIRAHVFHSVGGFDERYRRPCIEDIDLGYRLAGAGHLVLLDHELRVRHLKRWTFRSMLVSDIRDRGIPWTQLILRSGRFNNDLNLRSAYRISVALSYVLPVLLVASFFNALFLVPAGACVGVLYHSNRRFYRYFMSRRGIWFTLRVIPIHYLYHLYNGVSFALGSAIYMLHSRFGVELPGALPLEPWPAPSARPADTSERSAVTEARIF